jgi:DNA-binding winged helix-turn-helix (wHTH) protein
VPSRSFHFECFSLHPSDRQLLDGGRPVELGSRYFDALVLLVSEQGRLVAKGRFMDEVWGGIPVTDEALTQCIRTLRKQLGDDASSPRFIETVPKHGYRFIAPVETAGPGTTTPARAADRRQDGLLTVIEGSSGGGLAGLVGGLFYGFAAASAAPSGTLSVLLVLLVACIAVGLIGAAGVAAGIAAARALAPPARGWAILGAAAGGLIVGAVVKLLGLDTITILFGRSPGEITGAGEGLALGTAIGLAASLRATSLRRTIAIAALSGAAAGIVIAAAGGHLMGGSLATLAHHFPGSRLRLDKLSELFGERDFGPVTQTITSALEGSLFAACVVGALEFRRRRARWARQTSSAMRVCPREDRRAELSRNS